MTAWPGWGPDEELARAYAARIRQALAGAITTVAARRLAAAWLRFARRGSTAQAFIRMTEPDLPARFAAALRAVLVNLWRAAWNAGKSAAHELLPHHTPAPPGPGHDDGFEQWPHGQMPGVDAMADTRLRDLADRWSRPPRTTSHRTSWATTSRATSRATITRPPTRSPGRRSCGP
ncbi:hypothetical protein [Actinoallomurus rhizosphaericola]|uniref:hypothetical protein n=1 Tax=Actinoallomurus rhizosphaericola TaxID=2952536 RepID=UPI0020924C39|nr:hypothetical protein [Actinoallomurus rhizosphaericola]MCO5999785.1 hypothetical protein [Actinoallomurus rhizosphaericola]